MPSGDGSGGCVYNLRAGTGWLFIRPYRSSAVRVPLLLSPPAWAAMFLPAGEKDENAN